MIMQQDTRIGARLKAARRRVGLTQEQLADALGLRHRQTVASIEAGRRSLSAHELLRAMSALDVDLDYFTDSFRLVGEGRFSFRTSRPVADAVLDEFEERVGRWIAMYRELAREQGEVPQWLEFKLALTPRSTFEDAEGAGEALADHWQLERCPAELLRSAMEDRMRILVLDTDPPVGISEAIARVPGLSCVLVNRQDPEGRRNLYFADALFHLLTWDAMAPARKEPVEVPRRRKGWHVRRLAKHFASALLMPGTVLREYWGSQIKSADVHDRLNDMAVALRVPGAACKWRLRRLGLLSKADLTRVDDGRLVENGHPRGATPDVRPFSRQFVERVATALDAGRLSVRQTASLLNVSLPDLASLLRAYGHEPQFEAPASPAPPGPGTPGDSTPTAINIRPAQSTDRAMLVSISMRTIRASYTGFLGRVAVEAWLASGAVEAYLDQHRAKCRVVEVQGQVVGYCVAKGDLIDLLMVDSERHREGFGRVLLGHIEAELFEARAVLRLESFADNRPTNAFYVAQGWTPGEQFKDPEAGVSKVKFTKRRPGRVARGRSK